MMHILLELRTFKDDLNLSENPEQFREIFTLLRIYEYLIITNYLTAMGIILITVYQIWTEPGAGQDEMDDNLFERIQQTMRTIFILSSHP